jgi:RNA polymerase sigma-70 factor (ECF subfamily)
MVGNLTPFGRPCQVDDVLATSPSVPSKPTRPPERLVLTELLVRSFQTQVWRYLRFLGCPPSIADDLTQETFLALLTRDVQDRGPGANAAWLRGVAQNLFRERQRTLRRGLEQLDQAEIEHAFSRYVHTDGAERYHDALRGCMKTIGEKEREAVLMRYRDAASREAIAAAVGVSDEGAKTLLRRAKDKLRLCIQGRIGDE